MVGPLITLVGALVQTKRQSVSKWMKDRRIDKRKRPTNKCEFCGSPVKPMATHSGPRQKMKATVCSRYPECRYVRWENL